MPELPEVETITRGLASRVTGDVIESVWLGSKPEPLKSPAAEIAATLDGRRIAGVRRVGKHIVLDLVCDRVARAPSPAKKLKPPPKASSLGKKATKSALRKIQGNSSPTQSATQATAQWIVHLGMTGRLLVCQPDAELAKHTHAVVKLASGKELRFVDPRRFGRLSVAHGFEPTGSEPLEVQLDHFMSLFRGRKTPI
jgi:formamidopyrimidine-DNA glycosylase